MAADRLIVFERPNNIYRIGWYLAEEQDIGACLGEDPLSEISDSDWDYKAALEAIEKIPDLEKDVYGFYWTSKNQATKVLKTAKFAIKNCSMKLPDWATQALAAGWKPPKNWKS